MAQAFTVVACLNASRVNVYLHKHAPNHTAAQLPVLQVSEAGCTDVEPGLRVAILYSLR